MIDPSDYCPGCNELTCRCAEYEAAEAADEAAMYAAEDEAEREASGDDVPALAVFATMLPAPTGATVPDFDDLPF